MARHPDWFERLDTIEETVRQPVATEWFGRQEVAAAFGVSDRDSIRLLHKFGAREPADALAVDRAAIGSPPGGQRVCGLSPALLRGRPTPQRGVGGILSPALRVRAARPEGERARLEDPPLYPRLAADFPLRRQGALKSCTRTAPA